MNLNLKRFPPRKKDLLQAWDSADELLLQHLSSIELKGKRILIIHDHWGALTYGLRDSDVTTYTDSYLSFEGIQNNVPGCATPITELNAFSGLYDLVLIRIPKNMSYFEDILCHLSEHLHLNSKVICGYMIKHHAKASFDLLNKIIGETQTSLAQKKARLIFSGFERLPTSSPYPLKVQVESFEVPFTNHSNVFSREKLDIGTRFLLGHLPQGNYQTILDLGCGNGIVGIAAKQLNPKSQLIFSDESKMAIFSAKANYEQYFSDQATFHWSHSYSIQKSGFLDLVICNPPFHQGHTEGDWIARAMFIDAYRALASGGTLRVIGNTHLQYPLALKQIFGNSKIVATHPKFTIVDALKKCTS